MAHSKLNPVRLSMLMLLALAMPLLAACGSAQTERPFTIGYSATTHAKQTIEDTNIPIALSPVFDPVGSDYAERISHPGGNLTGPQTSLEIPDEILRQTDTAIRRNGGSDLMRSSVKHHQVWVTQKGV